MKFRVVAAALAAPALVLAAPSAAPASQSAVTMPESITASPSVSYEGLAFGTKISALDGTVTSGMTAPSAVSCTYTAGVRRNNSVAAVNLPLVGKVGAVTSVAQTTETTSWKRTNTQAEVAGVNLLGGAITADAIKSNSSAYAMTNGNTTGVNTFTFVNLKIAGQTIPVDVAKNTKVTVPGVAEVTVNKQSRTVARNGDLTSRTTGLSIRALPGNPLGLPTSTSIDIASTRAAVKSMAGEQLYSGNGFSTRVRALGGAVKSGATAAAGVPCLGGTRSSNLAGVNVPLLVNSGTTNTLAKGASDSTRDWTRVTNSTASPSLLGGLITADALKAETTTLRSKSTGAVTLRDTSEFVGLKIAGRPVVAADLAPNSTIEIPGVAKVTIHQQVKGAKSISVTMLRVELLSGVAGLPIGSVVEVGYSRSALK